MTQILCLKIFTSFLLILISFTELSVSDPLRGITLRNWPYANRLENGQFEGFVVDLLNEISRVAKITYTLRLSSNTEYGGWTKNGSVTGMIGEVFRNESDFAIGDITVLSNRDRYVNFSYPFMKFGLSALISKDNIRNISSFRDLSEQSDIVYGVKKYGANLPLFHDSPIVTKMYNYMDANPSSFVKGEKEGIKRVKTSRYAFITESPFNEYVINRDCDLTAVEDKTKLFEFEYAIAMRKDLLERYAISDAIRKLKKDGVLDELKDKYWKSDKCVENSNVRQINPKIAALREGREIEGHKDNKDHHKDPHRKHRRHGKGSAMCTKFSSLLNVFSVFLLFLINN